MIKTSFMPKTLRYPLVAFYVYGAAIHVANMAGWSGFNWLAAPQKWQILDVVYLTLDLGVVVGLLAHTWWGMPLLVLAAASQILLYTVLRAWVLDVPTTFEVDPTDAAYLDGLVVFHVACLSAVGLTLCHARITGVPT